MSPSLQQSFYHPPEGSPFQHHSSTNLHLKSGYDDNEIEECYDQLQNVIDQTPKKDILVVQGDWNAKVGRDACRNWQGICGPFCNDDTNERGLRLLSLPPLTTLCWRTHLVITRHPEDGHGIAQMDNTTTRLITF